MTRRYFGLNGYPTLLPGRGWIASYIVIGILLGVGYSTTSPYSDLGEWVIVFLGVFFVHLAFLNIELYGLYKEYFGEAVAYWIYSAVIVGILFGFIYHEDYQGWMRW